MASQQENLPMLEQYRRIKKEHKDAVLFFRLGDFYEMFAEDAIEVSALLNLTLTQRTGLPMCGVPHHAYRAYIARLLRYGKKVAVCEQLGEASKGKGIIERKVVEVISPGTTVDEDFLQQGSANHLAAFASEGSASGSGRSKLSFAYIDLSTGEFAATAFPLADCAARLRLELERLDVKEVLLEESLLEELPDIAEAFAERQGIVVNRWAAWLFDLHRSRDRLVDQFGEGALKSFGLKEDSAEQIAAGALLDYLQTTAQSLLPHVQSLHVYDNSEFVGIDENSLRNLELVRNLRDGSDAFTLYSVMNETRTAMGNRLLKYRILHPLREIKEINARLASTESLFRNQAVLSRLREILKKAPDLERLCSRLGMDKAHGKDMLSLRNALQLFEEIEGLVAPLG
ncbi:MAG: hypothetical protein LBM77_13335 [Spirochaetaceae bacterium]|nr:hypothetical protein [Spirochaetaceae bacterium]